MLSEDLREFSRLFSAYTELRVQENTNRQVMLVNGSNARNHRTVNGGVSARVYHDGSWGFASSSQMERASVEKTISTATDNAKFLQVRKARGKGDLPSNPFSHYQDVSKSSGQLEQKHLVNFAHAVDGHIDKTYPDLISRTVVVRNLDIEKTVLTSDGSHAYSMTPRSFIYVILSMEKDGQPVELFEAYGGLGSFRDVFPSTQALFGGLEKQYLHLTKKRDGVFAEAGVKTCVLDAELAGILAHEAIGHTTEADLVMGGSVAKDLVRKVAASPLVTLVDYAHTCDGENCPEPVYVDDEGSQAQDAVIIRQGVLQGFLHNKESALHFGVNPTGNARAFGFSDEPLIRMRNTAFVPGDSRLEEMIASVDDGYYLVKHGSGQADSTSEFMFGVTLGYEIKGGQLGRAIRDTTISGVAFDMLKTVSMVSDSMKWISSGMCGKKQMIPVGMGGPAIKCQVSIGGR